MPRPLRINLPDGWYHVYHRGTERRRIFADDRDREHFLELLEELHTRYRLIIHAYALMDNHYHGILQSPDANLSAGMQWLHTSYAAWFNARYDRVGPFWQGRFGSVPVENSAWAYELSLYVHLNPVCTDMFRLGKKDKKAEGMGLQSASAETISRRLKALREYRWSSYRHYAGYTSAPAWLETREILRRAGKQKATRVKRYRDDTKNLLRKGGSETRNEQIFDTLSIGSAKFREKIKAIAKGGDRETQERGRLRQRIDFEQAVSAVEKVKGQSREAFLSRHGDWGAAMVMWLLRQYGGMTLREIGAVMDGKDYAAVSERIRRFQKQIESDRKLMRSVRRAQYILNI
jgi:REP element-mobilizing transposase RayT